MTSIENPGPLQSILGRRIEMKLGEHSYRNKFWATIIGPVSVANEPYFDRMHLLELEGEVRDRLSVNHILFHPEGYDFHTGIIFRRGTLPKPREPYRPSLEKFLFSQNPALRILWGRVYTTGHIEALKQMMKFGSKYEFSMLAYGKVFRPKPVQESRT